MKIDIKEIIFWIFLALSIILLIWNVLGNSPGEFITIVAILLTILLKVVSISERLTKVETKFNYLSNSFINLAKDFKEHIKHK